MALQKNSKAALVSVVLGGAAVIAAHFVTIPSEGEKFKSYPDGGGVWTICRGHTKDVHEGMTATPDECFEFFKEDMADAEAVYNRYVKAANEQNVKASAIDFIFNTGPGNFKSSTLLKKLNASDRAGACAQYPRWNRLTVALGSIKDMRDGVKDKKADCRITKNDCYGLVTRREKERNLCLDKNNYSSFMLDADNVLRGVQSP